MAKYKLTSEKGLIICFIEIIGKGKPVFLKMALDTGTTTTIVPPESALSIGVNPVHSPTTTEVTTGSGTILCPIVTLPKFSAFGIMLKNFEVVCHTLPPESPVEGLLGLNFFKNIKLTLDFPKRTIEVAS